MAQILQFRPMGESTDRGTAPGPAGEVVAMAHVNLDTVVETVRVMRALNKIGLLDQFNGRGHAARQAQP